MKDHRILPFKLRAEKDNAISHGARTLIWRMATFANGAKGYLADQPMGLTWRNMATWFNVRSNGQLSAVGVKHKDTIYRWLRELVLNGYLIYCGIKAADNQRIAFYKLDLRQREQEWLFDFWSDRGRIIWNNHEPIGGKISQPIGGKISQPIGGKIPPPHISYSLREEMNKTKGKKSSVAHARRHKKGGGNNRGSLRSRGTVDGTLGNGKGASSVPIISELPAEDRSTQGCEPSAAVETGEAKPPGGDRKVPASLPANWQKMKKEHGL
jgi:hypothetical protein